MALSQAAIVGIVIASVMGCIAFMFLCWNCKHDIRVLLGIPSSEVSRDHWDNTAAMADFNTEDYSSVFDRSRFRQRHGARYGLRYRGSDSQSVVDGRRAVDSDSASSIDETISYESSGKKSSSWVASERASSSVSTKGSTGYSSS